MKREARQNKPVVRLGLAALLAGFLAIQLFPYGRRHANPPVTGEPPWDSQETRDLFYEACGDCHSNRTVWPWYSHLAPASWLVRNDVDHGRKELNVTEWGRAKNHGDDAAGELRDGDMPPASYRTFHSRARLDGERKAALVRGLIATFGDDTSHVARDVWSR